MLDKPELVIELVHKGEVEDVLFPDHPPQNQFIRVDISLSFQICDDLIGLVIDFLLGVQITLSFQILQLLLCWKLFIQVVQNPHLCLHLPASQSVQMILFDLLALRREVRIQFGLFILGLNEASQHHYVGDILALSQEQFS